MGKKELTANEIWKRAFNDELKVLRGISPSQLAHEQKIREAIKAWHREVNNPKPKPATKWEDVVRKEKEKPLQWVSRQSHWEKVEKLRLEEKKLREQSEGEAREGEAKAGAGSSNAGNETTAESTPSRWGELVKTVKEGPSKTQRDPPRKDSRVEWDKLQAQVASTSAPRSRKAKSASRKVDARGMKGGFDWDRFYTGAPQQSQPKASPKNQNDTARAKNPGFEDRLLSSKAKQSPDQSQRQNVKALGGVPAWDWDRFFSDAPQKNTPAGRNSTVNAKKAGSQGKAQLPTAKKSTAQPQGQKGKAGNGVAEWDWNPFYSDAPQGGTPNRQGSTAKAKKGTAQATTVLEDTAKNQMADVGKVPSNPGRKSGLDALRTKTPSSQVAANKAQKAIEDTIQPRTTKKGLIQSQNGMSGSRKTPLQSQNDKGGNEKRPWEFDSSAWDAPQKSNIQGSTVVPKARRPGRKAKDKKEGFDWGKFLQ